MSQERHHDMSHLPEDMSGAKPLEETIIPSPQVQWETATEMPTAHIEEVWQRLTHLGLVGSEEEGCENGAGWVPVHRFLPQKLRFTKTLEGTRAMEEGTRLRDAHKDSYVVTREVNEAGKSILWESEWPGADPIHYTYRITLELGTKSGTTVIRTGLRATNMSVGTAWALNKAGQRLDAKGMALFGRGLTEFVDPEQAKLMRRQRTKKYVGYAAALGVGVAGWRLVRSRSVSA